MSAAGSSPFVENPPTMVLTGGGGSTTTEEADLRSTISKLQFQLSSLQTEKKLLQQDREDQISEYKTLLSKKSKEFNELKSNFDFIFEEKKQLQSKLDNQSQIQLASKDKLQQEITDLKEKNRNATKQLHELESKHDRLVRKYQQVSSDWNLKIRINDELTAQLDHKDKMINELQLSNDNLIREMDNYSSILNNKDSLSTLNQNLLNKNASLQNTNNKLQAKIDQLLQTKTLNEVLKEKNISLTAKIQKLQPFEERYYQLDIEKLQLESKYNDLFKTLNESIVDPNQKVSDDDDVTNTIKVNKFIEVFKQTQHNNHILQTKLAEKSSENHILRQEHDDLVNELETNYFPQVEQLESKLKISAEQIYKLESTKKLNTQEIEYLRKRIKELEQEVALAQSKRQEVEQQPKNDKAIEEYLSNLEKLVEDYKSEIENLQQKLKSANGGSDEGITSKKRPRSLGDDGSSFKSQVNELEKENLQLCSKVKQLEYTIKCSQQKIQELEQVNTKRKSLQILQLKSNPLAKDQAIKQETLDALRKENLSLITKYIENKPSDELIPKAIFERQENDKEILQTKITQLSKRLTRLRDTYSKKSKDIITTISKYFGYSIEFLPSPSNPNELSSRLKLVSRYSTNKDSYLIIDIDSKSLKAYGPYEFKSICEELAQKWVIEEGQFPCLLSALNLTIYKQNSI
ncbi:MAD1 [[Candida] subhashii]|uniref:Spindle assembly checkpoint component MAD1 n=1 Tax=[Candida] subhashii TaxID=561895 RepID=A0A8J5UJG5_9ASCO|nr:MAD1 [[Candida] subhashii]KAG7661141.1 MAD1 [[Candida] subhashii]